MSGTNDKKGDRMRIEDIEAFVTVIRSGSLGTAAHILGISQATMSRRIQSLEESCGAPLLDRSTRPAALTARGEKIAAICHRILEETQTLRVLLAEDHQVSGDLHIGLSPHLAEFAAFQIFRSANELWGERLRPAIATDTAPALIRSVAQGALDLALVVMPGSSVVPQQLRSECLLRSDLIVVGRLEDGSGKSSDLASCSARGWVLNPDGCGFRSMLIAALQEQNLPFALRLAAFGSELQLASVAAGAGLGLVPRFTLEKSSLRDRLTAIKLHDFHPTLALHAIQRDERSRAQEALDVIVGIVRSGLPEQAPS
ncbi:LysR family transcriptional regulator [Agrobacterium tumefaciens]|uniref:LysR family transcriptional regulator n=2 Tax=Rhizobiaceae TaxID=82115 RepID=UPI002FDA1BC6